VLLGSLEQEPFHEPCDPTMPVTFTLLTSLGPGVGLAENHQGDVIAMGPPFVNGPTESLKIVEEIHLAPPNEAAPAVTVWVTQTSSSFTVRETLDPLRTGYPDTPGFRGRGVPAMGQRQHGDEQQQFVVAHARTIAARP
jgi:hypothetical protein